MSVRRQGFKRWLAAVLCTGVLCQALAVNVLAESNVAKALNEGSIQAGENIEMENGYSIADLQKQFPNGRYWNHADNPGAANNNPMGTTATRCTGHVNGYNTSTCNHPTFSYHYGCWGYADQLGYLYAGSNPNNWAKKTNTDALNYLKTGDIIRFTTSRGGEHSVFVTGVSGNNITFSDCNWPEYINSSWIGTCKIRWNVTKDKSYFEKLKYIEICPTSDPNPNPTPTPDPNADSLGCSTAYAGLYRVKNSAGANVNSRHDTNWGDRVAELPVNTKVYVTKANGTGAKKIGHIMYNGTERYVAMNLLEKVTNLTPEFDIKMESGIGGVSITGWAFDYDDCSQQLQIKVYLDDVLVLQQKATAYRPDVDTQYGGVGAYHGFDFWVPSSQAGNRKFQVYAVDIGTGNDSWLATGYINVLVDREPPTLTELKATNVTSTGFDVSCVSTDNIGVDHVEAIVWTADENSAVTGIANGEGNVYTYHVNVSNHGNASGTYHARMKSYDSAGNWRYNTIDINVPSDDSISPVITDVKITNLTSKGYDVSCTVTDNVGVNRVVFPTWTDRNGQDDIASEWWSVDHFATRGTQYGDTWTFHVDIADHNHESGLYHTHIYAYDDAGNRECNITDAAEVVVPEPASTVTFDANGGTAEFDSKEVEYGDVLGVLPEADRSHYVFLGWYTDPEDGDRVTDQSDVTGSMTLYAHWVPAFGAGWQLEDGVLTIENDGAMEDYAAASDAPWFRLRSQIQSVIVSEGVTSLSSYAFYGCDELEEVSLPQSLCRIGSLAFGGCTKLSSIVIPSDVLLIGDYAFVGDDALQTITFEGHAPEIGVGAFSDVTATVIYKGNDQSWTEDIRQSYLGSLTWTSSV